MANPPVVVVVAVAGQTEIPVTQFEFATYGVRVEQNVVLINKTYRSPKGVRVPLAHQTPSTHAPFLPMTARINLSSSWSYSTLAWTRETLLSAPRSTST